MKNKLVSLIASSIFFIVCSSAIAEDAFVSDYVINPYTGGTESLASTFSPHILENTRFLHNRKLKIVAQVGAFCRDIGVPNAACNAPKRCQTLWNLRNLIKDLKQAHGLTQEDYDIVAIAYGGGGPILHKEIGDGEGGFQVNQCASLVEDLMAEGVQFKYCLNTLKGQMGKTGNALNLNPAYSLDDNLIDGIGFVTAGVSAIPDYQEEGYQVYQPGR